jgi:hypothetical protein
MISIYLRVARSLHPTMYIFKKKICKEIQSAIKMNGQIKVKQQRFIVI